MRLRAMLVPPCAGEDENRRNASCGCSSPVGLEESGGRFDLAPKPVRPDGRLPIPLADRVTRDPANTGPYLPGEIPYRRHTFTKTRNDRHAQTPILSWLCVPAFQRVGPRENYTKKSGSRLIPAAAFAGRNTGSG